MTKRFLAIIILGVLLSSNAFSKILPNDSPEEQYQFAITFLKVADYENAELALREFVEINPDHELTGNAHYWYAETFRVRQLYKDAANAYLYGFEYYPKSPKAPMNQLKLGTMLIIIGQWNQGCEIISGVESQYPKAAQLVLTKVKEEYKNYRCQKSAKGPQDKYKIKGLEYKDGSKITRKPKKKKPKYDDKKIIIIGSGSGFFVTDQGHVVSNDHVIGICKKVIAYEEGKEINLDILATDMVNDIGLVRGKFQKVSYLNIKPGGAELGEDIVAFGYPLSRFTSDSVKLTKGIVSALSGPGNNFSQIQIDAAIQPGSSGGPILNMNGQVIGVAVSGLSKKLLAQEADYIPENVNFAVAAQSLMSFLKGNKISVGTGGNRKLSTKELAKIGEPATIQLFCMNTEAEYAKLKEADKHSDVLLDLK